MKYIFFFFCLLLIAKQGLSQKTIVVKGIVKTSDNKSLAGASIILYYKADTDSLKKSSGENGEFTFTNAKAKKMAVIVSYVGYATFTGSYDFSNLSGEQVINDIVMSPGISDLENITLQSSKIQIKEDTVSFLIDSSMYRKNDNVEELLKRLPGVQVDKSGTVTAQGKEVTKVKVNGKEFFGGDVRTATRELNADMVDRIQVIDDYGDQAAFTGVKDGDPTKTLNIQLKKDKNKGYFGNVTAGAGTDQRYVTSLSVNKFNNNQQLSLLGNWNNTNASLFNFGAIGGAMGSMISSMARGMGIGQGGGGVAATLGNFGINDGVGTTRSIGMNYRDEWGKQISAYGSYSYSQKSITTIKTTTQQNADRQFPNTNTHNSNDYTATDNHRFSFNIEYKLDSFNYFKFTPAISYRKTNSDYRDEYVYLNEPGQKINNGSILEKAISKAPNINGNLLFNHRFHKKGRTMSVNLNAGNSSTNGTDDFNNPNTYYLPGNIIVDSNSHQYIPQDNSNRNYGARISYIEPLSKKKSLEFSYAYNYQYTDNSRQTFIVDANSNNKTLSDSLSSIYDNVYITNRYGVNYRATEKKYNYTVGLSVQPGSIRSTSLKAVNNYTQQLVNFFPVVRFAYNFSRSRSFNVNYNGVTNQPGYTQLNPVRDESNSQNIIIGNPGLRPEFTNTFSTRYNNFDFISGNVFFGNIALSFTNDKIVTNSTLLGPSGKQEIRYLNTDGFYTVTAFYNISRPKQNRKYVFNWGGNIIYNNNISFIKAEKNVGKNWIFGQRLATDIKIKKWLETSFAVNYTLNRTRYSSSVASFQNTTINTWGLSHSSRVFISEDFIFSYDMEKTINYGYSDNVTANPLIINSSLEKQFFKKKNLAVKFQAFDVLNENKGISRLVSGNSITDTRTNRLARYFMLSFVLRLNKFKGDQQMQMGPGGMMPPQGTPGGMRPF
ncbi:MAG: outer membrane beta-barrel protein [Ferruginibacter sp.]|nr:outer membrane beta-barrel protein [Ferruginibacter sp.]